MTDAAFSEIEVRPGVFVYTLGGESIETSYGSNCTAVVGRSAVLLVDPLIVPSHARLVEQALASRTDAPVRFVVLTHHHTDHALGAGHFARRGATVLAHAACAARMAAEHPGLVASRRANAALASLFHDAEPYAPALTFEEDVTLDLGGSLAHVWHTGHGHTRGDAILHLSEESVAVCGDLVSNAYHVNYEDAVPTGLAPGLEALAALGCRTYIPGHGAPGGPELLTAQASYHAAARDAARDPATAKETLCRLFPSHRLPLVAGHALIQQINTVPGG